MTGLDPVTFFARLPLAQNQQQEVLRAINDATGSTVSPWVLWGIFGALGVVVAGALLWQRWHKPRPANQRKVLRHPRKLMREIARELDLSPDEVHKLEHHAANAGVDNPLTLLLCPSVLKKDAGKKADKNAA